MKPNLLEAAKRGQQFVQTGIWQLRPQELPFAQSFLVRQLRVVVLAARGFAKDQCPLRASALTLYVLLSIVPVLAMAFGVAQGFGFQNYLRQRLLETFKGQEEVVTRLIESSYRNLESTRGGVVAGVGFLVLIWSVIKVLGSIEASFNAIWGIQRSRNLGRKIADYLAIVLIAPALLVISGSATVFVSAQAQSVIARLGLTGVLGPAVTALLGFLPYVFVWLLFSLAYLLIPNTQVPVRSALLAGVVTGTIYQLVQYGYVNSQVSLSKAGAIYGSFAALPLFIVWLQLSWLIVLLGAEICFAHQNVDTYEYEPQTAGISHAQKRLFALRIAQICVRRFEAGQPPLNAPELARETGLPIRLTRAIVDQLVAAGVLSLVEGAGSAEGGYQPARSTERLTIGGVIALYEQHGVPQVECASSPELEQLERSLEAFAKAVESSPANRPLKEL